MKKNKGVRKVKIITEKGLENSAVY